MEKIDLLNKKIMDFNLEKGIIKSVVIKNDLSNYVNNFLNAEEFHDIRSLSKLIVSLCVGVLLFHPDFEHKSLNVNSCIWPFFKTYHNKINNYNIDKVKKIKICHLLNQTTGFNNDKLCFSKNININRIDYLLEDVLNEPIIFEPGEKFVYSNGSAYILSALIQLISGLNLLDFANKYIFIPLNITVKEWKKYGDFCSGATGCKISICDFAKIIELILNDGFYKNKEIISNKYISLMKSQCIESFDEKFINKILLPKSYTYFLWKINDNQYFVNGANGQIAAFDFELKKYIIIFSNTTETKIVYELVKDFFEK